MTKNQPLTIDRFEEFFALKDARADSEHSWTLARAEIEARGFDLKAVNPNAKSDVDTRTPAELLAEIEERHAEVGEAIAELRRLL
ncbi:MAG: type restriction enzyme protein [Chloroflexota bacterium]|nr:type restriction enzyme protein [Chloroflexota bacterium]